MGPVRRSINLGVALALTAGSIFSFIYLLFFAAGYSGKIIMAAGVLAFVGLYWLWADYINADPRPEN
jgi:hypothetical protein